MSYNGGMNPSDPHPDDFAALPADLVHAAPTAAPPRLRRAERDQLIPAMRLEDLLTADHQARVVWQFVQGVALTPLYAGIRAVEGGPGAAEQVERWAALIGSGRLFSVQYDPSEPKDAAAERSYRTRESSAPAELCPTNWVYIGRVGATTPVPARM